jgi:hypothetical protein
MAEISNGDKGDTEMVGGDIDPSDDATAKGGNSSIEFDARGREMKEHLIKIEFTGKHGEPMLKNVYKTHAKLLTILFRKELIESAIDNKNEPVNAHFDVCQVLSVNDTSVHV